jgi:hypothetical protein
VKVFIDEVSTASLEEAKGVDEISKGVAEMDQHPRHRGVF